MTGMEYVAICLGAGFVLSTALLVVALGCIDVLRDDVLASRQLLERERRIRRAQDAVLMPHQRVVVDLAAVRKVEPGLIARHVLRALNTPVKDQS